MSDRPGVLIVVGPFGIVSEVLARKGLASIPVLGSDGRPCRALILGRPKVRKPSYRRRVTSRGGVA